ncbi:MAG: hypothetical protein LBO20_01075 [Bifidobacteriaceae bacterium]|nr:hypothetical protein [Bifidobacteriaceae bacterium]
MADKIPDAGGAELRPITEEMAAALLASVRRRAQAPKAILTSPAAAGSTAPTAADAEAVLAGAHLGFTEAQAAAILADHQALVLLGRLWDAARGRDGQAVGPVRVPPRIWALAEQDTARGLATCQLLEATGLRAPPDFGQALDFHLRLWAAEGAAPVRQAGGEPPAGQPLTRCDGPVWAQARRTRDGVEVEVRSPYAGRFEVELHWPDGSCDRQTTPQLAAGQPHTYLAAEAGPGLPSSIRLTRKAI